MMKASTFMKSMLRKRFSDSCFRNEQAIIIWVLILQLLYSTNGSLEKQIDHCCSLGRSVAIRDVNCNNVSVSSPVKEVDAESQSVCLSMIQLCCAHQLRVVQCDDGIVAANSGTNCPKQENESKYCCEACKMGIIAAASILPSPSQVCTVQKATLDCSWNSAYLVCCTSTLLQKHHSVTNTTTSTQPDPRMLGGQTEDETETYGICDLYPGELCAHICISSPSYSKSSYICKCNQGFSLMADGKSCMLDSPQDRCVIDNPCHQLCHDSGKSIECLCFKGYQLQSDNKNCIDIDECKRNPVETSCDSNQICENTPGSYKCLCRPGYQLDQVTQACVDINECQVDLHNCASSQRCDNTIGSFQCVRYVNCGTGYTLNAQTGQCEDDDECTLNTHNCNYIGDDFICRNTLGSFRCEKLDKSSNKNSSCLASSLGGKCSPISGSICALGFEAEGSSGVCVDIDECAKGIAKCAVGQKCINKPGGYMCSTLKCESGFRVNGDRTRCIDIDECTEQPRICDHKCYNYWGSYRCSCNSGFTLQSDNRTCIDLNECELFKDRRLCSGYCRNQPGSYSCQCPNGYTLASDSASCQDIDECKDGPGCTNQDEICMNMRGSYRCNLITCPAGYIKENLHKNRCRKEVLSCRVDDKECSNQPTSISFYFITLTSNYSTPAQGLPIFTLRGPSWADDIDFALTLKWANTPANVMPASDNFFYLQRTAPNQVLLKLMKPLAGPQDVQIDIGMTVSNQMSYSGKTLSKLTLFVSAYDF